MKIKYINMPYFILLLLFLIISSSLAQDVDKIAVNNLIPINTPDCPLNQDAQLINELFNDISKINNSSNDKRTLNTDEKQKLLVNIYNKYKNQLNFEKITIYSKQTSLCSAIADMVLALNSSITSIIDKAPKAALSDEYFAKAEKIYITHAQNNDPFAIKYLCVPNQWAIDAVSKSAIDVCINKLDIRTQEITSIDKAKSFSAIYGTLFLSFKDSLPKRVKLCNTFSNNINFMNYMNSTFKQKIGDMCEIDILLYGENLYINQDYVNAFKLYLSVNPKNNKTGIPQFDLGYMYQKGLGTEQNLDKALYWYKSSLIYNEDPATISNIGIIYVNLGDYPNAFAYCQQGAKKGNALSQYHLAKLYFQGRGVLQDNIEAYAWISAAAAKGVSKKDVQEDYQSFQNEIEQFRNYIKNQLIWQDNTGNALKTAQLLAESYYKKYVLMQGDAQINNQVNNELPTKTVENNSNSSFFSKLQKSWNILTTK